MERALFVPDSDRIPHPDVAYDRLYLGSEFCVWRLPGEGELREALAAATRGGRGFSLVTPFLDEPGLVRTLALVRALPSDPATEVIANDLGLIEALRATGWPGTVVAGRLLTRQRRGPGFQSFGDIPPEAAAALRGSALDSPAFVALLGAQYGVRRFELDDLVQGVSVPDLPAGVSLSLYRPYLLVTATRNCPWVFDGGAWRDRGRGCARPCRARALRLVPVAGQAPSSGGAKSQRADAADFPRAPCGQPGEPASQSDPCARSRDEVADGRVPDAVRATEACRAGINPAPTTKRPGTGEGFAPSRGAADSGIVTEGPRRRPPLAPHGTCAFPGDMGRTLHLGGCAQFLEHHSADPPPPGVDRIVWQPDIPA